MDASLSRRKRFVDGALHLVHAPVGVRGLVLVVCAACQPLAHDGWWTSAFDKDGGRVSGLGRGARAVTMGTELKGGIDDGAAPAAQRGAARSSMVR